MARNQKSWGLKFVLASIVLLFCLAVTTVEGRSVPFLAQLTPENTGKTNSKNNEYVGQAFAYLANRGRSFRASILVTVNIDPAEVSNVQLYDLTNEELIAGTTFTYIEEGYFALDTTIDADTNALLNIESVAVYVYLETIGTKRPALSGVLVNNPYSHIASLRADQEVTTPTGVSKNVGFASVITSQATDGTWTLSLVVNHDLDQRVTSISLHAPAASNTENSLVVTIPSSGLLQNAGKIISTTVDVSVVNYLSRHLAYVNIVTSKNTAGALRGQVIPTTTPRYLTPTFPNSATQDGITFLPDGSQIFGGVGDRLRQGGARNYSDDREDRRVARFSYNVDTSSFNNNFRFKLPVTLKNKYSIRGVQVNIRAAAAAAETGKYTIGAFNLATSEVANLDTFTTTGIRDFGNVTGYPISVSEFPEFLAPGGVFINIAGASLTGDLYVDQFFASYFINNAYANNIVKSLFYSGSNLVD